MRARFRAWVQWWLGITDLGEHIDVLAERIAVRVARMPDAHRAPRRFTHEERQ